MLLSYAIVRRVLSSVDSKYYTRGCKLFNKMTTQTVCMKPNVHVDTLHMHIVYDSETLCYLQ